LARRRGISGKTAYKWIKSYGEEGLSGGASVRAMGKTGHFSGCNYTDLAGRLRSTRN
jgi:transposase